MFGPRPEDRQRWDRGAATAAAIERGLDDHTKECTRRYAALETQLGALAKALGDKARSDDAWNKRLMVGVVTVLLGVIASLLHAKGFW